MLSDLELLFRCEFWELRHVDCLFVLVLWIYLPGIIIFDQVDLGLHGLVLVVELVWAQLHWDVLSNELLNLCWLHGFSPVGLGWWLVAHRSHVRGILLLLWRGLLVASILVRLVVLAPLLVVLLRLLPLVVVVALLLLRLLTVIHLQKNGNRRAKISNPFWLCLFVLVSI